MSIFSVDLNPGSIIKELAGLADDLFTSDDERNAYKLKVLELEQQGRLDDLKARLSAILAEAQSADPWTSRARPAFLYVMYLMFILCMVGSIVGIWYPDEVKIVATNLGNLFDAIPSDMYYLFGFGYLGYSGARSWEKVKKATK